MSSISKKEVWIKNMIVKKIDCKKKKKKNWGLGVEHYNYFFFQGSFTEAVYTAIIENIYSSCKKFFQDKIQQ